MKAVVENCEEINCVIGVNLCNYDGMLMSFFLVSNQYYLLFDKFAG
jgi:hypothetical protein